MNDIKKSVTNLILLIQNKEKKMNDVEFLFTVYRNNIPSMIDYLAVHHFENEGKVEGRKEDWGNVRQGLLNLKKSGVYYTMTPCCSIN